MDDTPPPDGRSSPRYIRSRIANACDGCKTRKVKCDGQQPCSYCAGRGRGETCHYSAQQRRRQRQRQRGSSSRSVAETRNQQRMRASLSPNRREVPEQSQEEPEVDQLLRPRRRTTNLPTDKTCQQHATKTPAAKAAAAAAAVAAGGRQSAEATTEDDTEVPREARLLRDAHGKLIFIGDCAPLSFFQSVRQVVTSRVSQNAFAPQTSRYSVLENAPAQYQRRREPYGGAGRTMPVVNSNDVAGAVAAYLSATTGLIDLFDNETLLDDMLLWADQIQQQQQQPLQDMASTIKFLVLAVGKLMDDEALAQEYFEYARGQAYADLSGDLSVQTVQAFVLITVYMLCSCQINGAFLFFGIAGRAAYSIGIHRTEVNARFGNVVHRQRDRLWKSLRVVDLFLSTSMGRPPATSDVDCTVPYRLLDQDGNEITDLLNASVQILLITEEIVLEIYSRKKISLQLTEGISHQLRHWSERWLQQLKDILSQPQASEAEISGACQVLASYYYSVMLVSRPFLMYELYRRLSDGLSGTGRRGSMSSGKTKLADACIDAASLMVDPVLDLIERNVLKHRAPMLVSWLFAASLVLGVGLLGNFGRILEKYTLMSIQALDHFAQSDGHATQYSLIAQSLLTTALEYLERREMQERQRRTENSSQLFGLVPPDGRPITTNASSANSPRQVAGIRSSNMCSPAAVAAATRAHDRHYGTPGTGINAIPAQSPRLGDIDSAFLGLSDSMLHTPDGDYWNTFGEGDGSGSALNLFPLLEAGGGIDLAHYL